MTSTKRIPNFFYFLISFIASCATERYYTSFPYSKPYYVTGSYKVNLYSKPDENSLGIKALPYEI